jgi:type II secretory pathway pseudopilin PulG
MTSPQRSRPRRQREAGFTLVETLIVVTTLAIAVLGLTNVAVSTAQIRQIELQRATAARVLEREIREIESADFATLQATYDNHGFDVVLEGRTVAMLRAVKGDADGLTGHVTVRVPSPPNDPTKLLELEVRIDWLGSNGPQHLQRSIRRSRLGASS